MIIRKTFASIAEAVAYYVEQGYWTVEYATHGRIMRRDRDEVIIYSEGFMQVVGEEVTV